MLESIVNKGVNQYVPHRFAIQDRFAASET